LANNIHLHGRSKDTALHVCFIQKHIQDGFLNIKLYPTAVPTADMGTKTLPRVPFENFTD